MPKSKGSVPNLYPIVTTFPLAEPFALSPEQVRELKIEGAVKITRAIKRELNSLGNDWLWDESQRQAARPKDFLRIIRKAKRRLEAAIEVLDFNPAQASPGQRHFLHWLFDQEEKSAAGFLRLDAPGTVGALSATIRYLDDVERSLPPDPGRARPHNDTLHIVKLAEIYERAGGKAKASHNTYKRVVNTTFFRFARAYYRMLPVMGKRVETGFALALGPALAKRKPTPVRTK